MNLNIFYNQDMKKDIVNYINMNFKADIDETVLLSDEFCKDRFRFVHKWDMERCDKTYTFDGDIQWDKTFNGDSEWTFMLNRHRYLLICATSYLANNDEKYTKTFIRHITHWIDTQKYSREKERTTWRNIELGMRCENWIRAYILFSDSTLITKEFREKFKTSLNEQATRLFNNYIPHKKLSNWGIIESVGLLYAGIFLDNSSYIDKAIERLQGELLIQVMPDGSHWEQSPMYSNTICSLILGVIALLKNNNIEVPKIIVEKSKAMLYAALYMKKPNHHQVCQSDSDDTDLRDIITKGAYIHKDKILKFGGYDKIDFENLIHLGIDALEYNDMEKVMPKDLSYALNHSGNYYLRSSFEEDAHYLYFHCGTLGSGHGHADLLHFSIFANGRDYLIDSGRGTYVDNELRKYLKSPKAHNTTTVDGKDFTIYSDSWEYRKVANEIKHPFSFSDRIDYIEGSHMGYFDIGVFTNRQIVYIKPDIWIISDNFYTEDEHMYNQYFHFASDIVVDGNKTICGESDKKLTLTHLTDVDKKVQKDVVSYRYNETTQTDTLVTTFKNKGFTSISTVISTDESIVCEKIPVKNYENQDIDKNIASAIKIIKGDTTYIIVLCHNEAHGQRRLFVVDKHHVYGKVIVITESENTNNIDIIKY